MEKLANVRSKPRTLNTWTAMLPALVVVMLVLSGCSLLFGGGPEEPVAEEQEDRAVVPTFTPTPDVPATPTPEPEAAEPPAVEVAVTENSTDTQVAPEAATGADAVTGTVTDTGTVTGAVTDSGAVTDAVTNTSALTEPAAEGAPVAEATAAPPVPKLTVNTAIANARNGPGTNYGLSGAVEQGQTFDIVGKNADGTWWQFCCVNGQQAWVFGELVTTENAEAVAVAQNIPAPPEPVAAVPTPVPQAPAPEQPAPEQPAPEQQPPEAPPADQAPQAANAGPCGGDDGCKFHIRTGPVKMQNSGGELKIQAAFIHSGVDGGQMQGDYRIGIEKDGQLIETFANVTSIALSSNDGPAGKYNYEAKVNASELPGGSLAGTYFFWVLDGNRERDSEVFRLDLGGNEGELYIEFDQA